jgi:hypothetical protein
MGQNQSTSEFSPINSRLTKILKTVWLMMPTCKPWLSTCAHQRHESSSSQCWPSPGRSLVFSRATIRTISSIRPL